MNYKHKLIMFLIEFFDKISNILDLLNVFNYFLFSFNRKDNIIFVFRPQDY